MKGFGLMLTATALVLLALAAQSHAQATVATTITYDNVTSTSGAFNPFITYGQQAQFQGAIVGNGTAVPGSCPFMWMNQTQTISALPQISQATTNQALQYGFEFEWNEPSILAAGTYSAVHGVFPGCTVNGVVFAPTDSRLSNTSQVPFDAFLSVSPAFTALTASFTPFTLANFTQSILVNLTNVNNTNQQPQGISYAVIVDSSGNTIGNFTLVATGINPNTVALSLPSTFNATALLQTGSYTETITYYPTSNFTQPSPLVIQFQITNVPVPAPPPPPLVFPPPPPPGITPPSPPAPPAPWGNNSFSTTITVQVFYNQVNGKIMQNACQSRTLYFVANVKPTYPGNSCPTDGIITFVDETGTVLAQGPATPCGTCQIGLTVSFSSQGGSFGIGYGSHSVTAAYSGSTTGWLPSKAVANYIVPSTCTQESMGQLLAGQKTMFDNALQSTVNAWMGAGASSTNGQTTVTYTPGGCTGDTCTTSQCQGSACGSVTGSLPSVTGGVPGSYYNGGCSDGGCATPNTIG
ncbi:hypothetical protein CVIRNUC_001007 [Coccomyxa viridis]|uniref:Extracellular protein n=1 Tax=Coccomyxa viridis TaxID=1274662 RepID=A0AAV1HUR4_9CHLO|nr:hypothetical protein CVIRNUC_001007 [Coccomyxa viridis]